MCQTDKQLDRQTDRQTDKQTDKQTNRQTDRQTERQTSRQTDKRTGQEAVVAGRLLGAGGVGVVWQQGAGAGTEQAWRRRGGIERRKKET